MKEAIDIGMIVFGALQTLALFLTFLIMRGTAIRQLRAYVALERARFIRNPKDDNGPWKIEVVFKNYGLTPARKLGVKVEAEIGKPKAPDIVIPLSKKAIPRSKVSPPPQHVHNVWIECPEVAPGDAGFHAACHAENKAYVWGRVDYIDAFKRPRFISFQMVCNFGEVADFAICNSGNDSD